jgi:hypothetical protein
VSSGDDASHLLDSDPTFEAVPIDRKLTHEDGPPALEHLASRRHS